MQQAARWLQAWDGQGWHRTATAGDQAGADWLLAEARSLGAAPERELLTVERLDPLACWLEADGERIEAVPVFDAPSTAPDGVAGHIDIASFSPWDVYSGAYRQRRQQALHDGLVIVCQGTHPGLSLLNAEQFKHPYGAPALHVSSEERERVLAARSLRLVAHSQRRTTQGCNVVVTLRGRHPGRTPLVVMTPRSSWWQSTSERGGGLVCWLESLRALLAEPPVCDVVLTANTGHELGHLGLDDFVARRSGWDRASGATWVHYGANLGAVGGALSVVSAEADMQAMMAKALAAAGQPADTLPPTTQVPSGETRDIHRAGGRYVTLVGSNPLFHLPQDRWPHAVDPAAVGRIAEAAARLVVALSR